MTKYLVTYDEIAYYLAIEGVTKWTLASAGSFVHLNKERVDFVNDYGMTEAQVSKLLSIPYDEFTKLFEYATDLNDINRHYRITTAFRSRRKFKPVEELKKYIEKEDLAKFEYLRENNGLIKYR